MNDAVNRHIIERSALDRGFPGGMLLSVVGHALLVAVGLGLLILTPPKPRLQFASGFMALPPGGHGSPNVTTDPAPAQAPPKAPSPKPEVEPPKPKREIIKPPKDDRKTGLPMPDAKKARNPVSTPAPPRSATGAPGGTGTGTETPGLSMAPVGPGIPSGTDPNADWYIAGVQRKIWLIWTRQIKLGMKQPITVTFTILADGSVEGVQLLQPSGVYQLDAAAQRAVLTAAPFTQLPKHYGTDRITIQATFKADQ